MTEPNPAAAILPLTILVPVFNEAGNVAPLKAQVEQALKGRVAYELLFVDDGSSDATLSELKALKASDPAMRIVAHAERCGKSAALVTGMRAAPMSGRTPSPITVSSAARAKPAISVIARRMRQRGRSAGSTPLDSMSIS